MTITKIARDKARLIDKDLRRRERAFKRTLEEIEFMKKYNICPNDGENLVYGNRSP
jgi:hypothetical protein